MIDASKMVLHGALKLARLVCDYTKTLENEFLREWDAIENPGIHEDPPLLRQGIFDPPRIFDPIHNDYHVFHEGHDKEYNKVICQAIHIHSHDDLFDQKRKGTPPSRPRPSGVAANPMPPIPRKSSSSKSSVDADDQGLLSATAKTPQPESDDKKEKKKRNPSPTTAGNSTKKFKSSSSQAKPLPLTKKSAEANQLTNDDDYADYFGKLLLQGGGLSKSGLTKSKKNASSLSELFPKDVLEDLRRTQRSASNFLNGIDASMGILKNDSLPEVMKVPAKAHVESFFTKLQHSFDLQKKQLQKNDSQKVVAGMHDLFYFFFAILIFSSPVLLAKYHHRSNEDCHQTRIMGYKPCRRSGHHPLVCQV